MNRVLLVLSFLFLSACDDPAPVGTGMVDEQAGDPTSLTVTATSVSSTTYRETTGNAPRALFGQVDDPVLGSSETIAYLDFVSPGVLTGSFQNGQVTRATLVLAQDYVYGDTTRDATVRIREISAAWLGQNAKADTTLQVGSSVTTVVRRLKGGTIEIPLPAAWISKWDAALRGTTFNDAFFGFEISSETKAGVAGLAVLGSSIRAVAGGDTTFFPAARSLTRIVRAGQPSSTSDRLFIQDGNGQIAYIGFDVAQSGPGTRVLNRGLIRVAADSSLTTSAPTGFVRPAIRSLQLDWITTGGARVTLASASRLNGRFDFQSDQLFDSLNVLLRGKSHFDHFELRVPPAENGLSVIGLPRGSAVGSPRMLLAVTPVE